MCVCDVCDPVLSQQEKFLLANREKDKGNEAFRANDYEEAVAYYSRSLSILPTVTAYNNRAQAEINLQHWHNAMRDCQQVLELEPRNKKGAFTAPAERGDMGNAQKKPHGRGDGGPHSESSNSHHGHWRGKGGASDKYKVTEESKVANGSSKRGSTASVQGDKRSGTKGTTGGGKAEESVNLDAPCGALPPHLSRLKNEGNLLFKNGQFADALEKYSQAIQGYTDSGEFLIVDSVLFVRISGGM
ncbi:hypothetical protein GOODEAATRI_012877 [Goodea atripinnis]|uniref:Uncharacterized protein n=1 Tax=Goodea atripinnis TaxID=208336 RepID=A0ABV0N101_9TELE